MAGVPGGGGDPARAMAKFITDGHERAREERVQTALRGRAVTGLQEAAARFVPDWRYVGDPGEPVLNADWDQIAGAGNRVRFWRDPFGFVRVGGLVAPTTLGSTTIFTLPLGYRPPETGIDWIGGTIDPAYVGVGSTGTVTAVAPTQPSGKVPAGHIIKLSPIQFYAEG